MTVRTCDSTRSILSNAPLSTKNRLVQKGRELFGRWKISGGGCPLAGRSETTGQLDQRLMLSRMTNFTTLLNTSKVDGLVLFQERYLFAWF